MTDPLAPTPEPSMDEIRASIQRIAEGAAYECPDCAELRTRIERLERDVALLMDVIRHP